MTSLPVLLPDGFSPSVKVGDAVIVGQILSQKTAKREYVINIPEQFSIPLSQVKHVLKKYPGESIEKGEIVGIKKRLFGIKKVVLRSGISGIIVRYERDSGNLVVKTGDSSKVETVVSPVEGTITLCDNKKILIEIDKHVVSGKRSRGENSEGEVFVLEASLREEEAQINNILYYLDSQAIGKVVVGGTFSRELLIKGIGLGVKGIVGTHISDEDMEYLAQKHSATSVMEIDVGLIHQLREWQGRKIYLDSQANSIIFLQL